MPKTTLYDRTGANVGSVETFALAVAIACAFWSSRAASSACEVASGLLPRIAFKPSTVLSAFTVSRFTWSRYPSLLALISTAPTTPNSRYMPRSSVRADITASDPFSTSTAASATGAPR